MKVYTIIEREGNKKSLWLHIGTALKNKDGSLTVLLNALPVNGTLHIREDNDGVSAKQTKRVES